MIQNEVYLRKEDHKYFDSKGKTYSSVSHVLNSVEEGFDAEKISRQVAGKGKYAGMTADQVKAQWKGIGTDSANHGTSIHDALEHFGKNYELKEEHTHLMPMVQSIIGDYRPYKKVHDECVLYHPDYMIAGTADKILEINTRKNIVDIEDYKTNNRKGIVYFNEFNKFKLHPVSHLSDCNFNRYTLQMSIYGLMYEKLTGGQVRALWIRYIPADNPLNHKRIPVPYMRTDAENILKNFYYKKDVSSSEIESPIFNI